MESSRPVEILFECLSDQGSEGNMSSAHPSMDFFEWFSTLLLRDTLHEYFVGVLSIESVVHQGIHPRSTGYLLG